MGFTRIIPKKNADRLINMNNKIKLVGVVSIQEAIKVFNI